MTTALEKRVYALEVSRGGGPRCPECGGPSGGGGKDRPPLITIRNAKTGAFDSARRGGEEITEEEAKEIKERECSLCDKGPEINIGGEGQTYSGGLK